jgi:hypothetical protein
MPEINPPLFQDVDLAYSGDEMGLPFRDLIAEGVLGSADLKVSERAAGGANMSVDVAAGACWVRGDESVAQPTYRCRSDSVVNLAVAAAHASNPRKDIVIAEVLDATFAGVSRIWRVRYVVGVAAASPAEPALPNNALKLATVDVTAADASIANAQITDQRVMAANALGGLVPIYDKTLLAAAASVDIQGIPATFESLLLVAYVRSDAATTNDTLLLRLNGDSAANYDSQVTRSFQTTGSHLESVASTAMQLYSQGNGASAPANVFSMSEILIPNYANALQKVAKSSGGSRGGSATGGFISAQGFHAWRSNAVINRLTLLPITGSFVTGTRVALFGLGRLAP